ncbi:MAG: response regulator [Verrucomicrobiia bacterium]|jgi:DNA-binding response OmpR family regulator
MKNILIIEDDSLVADVYSRKLREQGFAVDVAADGRAGLEMFHDRKVDLVLLDLVLPQIDGVQVLKQIRAEFGPQELPVLAFTNAHLGGVVRQAWEAGANQVIPKAGTQPSLVIQMVENTLAGPPLMRALPSRTTSKAEFDPVARKTFLDSSSETLAALWRPLKQLASQGYHPDNLTCFRELLGVVRPLTTTAASVGLQGIAQMSSALEALLQELCDAPYRLSPSALLTIAQAIDTLKSLFTYPDGELAKHPAGARILVVDDDAFARQAVSRVLSRVNLRAICVDSSVRALKRRTGNGFDLIVLDIELPDANGFDLCSRFRAMPACRNTPIIFLSMHKDLKDRTESVLRGGNDYITKPFLHMELATKALSFVIGGRLKPAHPAWELNGNGSESAFSRRDVNALKQVILGSYDS